jgi:endonuclease/exonuclease/phosphatase family metal-dependent hydrolase
MKLVSYNLRFGGKKGSNPWQQLQSEFLPDIVFAQESRHPKDYFDQGDFSAFRGCVHTNVATHGQWGSAILSRASRLESVSLSSPVYEGWVVGAMAPDVMIGGKSQAVLLFSLHAPTLNGSYERHVENIVLDIAARWRGTPMILAGDFNHTTAFSKLDSKLGENTAGERRILGLLKDELGLVNAWQHLHPEEELPQTLRWSGNKSIPYHCDGVFVHTDYLPYLSHASVRNEGDWISMSDHNPVLATLD